MTFPIHNFVAQTLQKIFGETYELHFPGDGAKNAFREIGNEIIEILKSKIKLIEDAKTIFKSK